MKSAIEKLHSRLLLRQERPNRERLGELVAALRLHVQEVRALVVLRDDLEAYVY